MNDTELDQLLNVWSVPPVPASLRVSVRAGFDARPRRRWLRWPGKFLFAAAALGVVTFLLAVTLALPQTLSLVSPPVRAPYIVDSDVVRYGFDGTPSIELSIGSYNNNGSEIVVSEVAHSLLPAIKLGLQAVEPLVGVLTGHFVVSHEQSERDKLIARVSTGFEGYWLGSAAALIDSGCVNGPVVGHETILNHRTVAVRQFNDVQRMTLWMAPDLGCFALRLAREERRADGTFRLVLKKQATKVTPNP
jgi:hypothetical protein